MSVEANPLNWNVSKLIEEYNAGRINFNVAIQRGEGLWDSKRNSLLIHSILIGLMLPDFLLNKIDGKYEGLDGKQRTKAICDYVNKSYKLHSKTPNIIYEGKDYEVKGRYYDDLPEELQNTIMRFGLKVYWFDNLTNAEKKLVFSRINAAKPITPAELARIDVLSRNTFITLSQHPAMNEAINDKQRKRLLHEDIIEDVWCVVYDSTPNLMNSHRAPLLAENEVTEEQAAEITSGLDYVLELYRAISDKKFLTKIKGKLHLISTIYAGILASRKSMSKEEYTGKVIKFFTTDDGTASISKVYNKASRESTSKNPQITARLKEIEKMLK